MEKYTLAANAYSILFHYLHKRKIICIFVFVSSTFIFAVSFGKLKINYGFYQ